MPSIILEQCSSDSKRREEPDFDLKEWSLKAKIGRENTNSRRFSASNLKSFREDEKSFRSNLTNISSTVSSPGYSLKDEIDPSTYSFTTALKALQAKTMYSWEYVSSDGYTLNSKWNEAEKYICNPLSGQVPLECLSAKTLSGRSFRSFTRRITMSAPLIYPCQFQAKSPVIEHENETGFKIQEKKKRSTRDIGIQITPADLSSDSSSVAAPTLLIEERSKKHGEEEAGDLSVSSRKHKPETEPEVEEEREKKDKEKRERKMRMRWRKCSSQGGGKGCLPFKGLCQRHKCKSNSIDKKKKNNNNNNSTSSPTFLYHINASYNQ